MRQAPRLGPVSGVPNALSSAPCSHARKHSEVCSRAVHAFVRAVGLRLRRRPAQPQLRLVALGLQHANVRQRPVLLREVQPVPHNKLVGALRERHRAKVCGSGARLSCQGVGAGCLPLAAFVSAPGPAQRIPEVRRTQRLRNNQNRDVRMPADRYKPPRVCSTLEK